MISVASNQKRLLRNPEGIRTTASVAQNSFQRLLCSILSSQSPVDNCGSPATSKKALCAWMLIDFGAPLMDLVWSLLSPLSPTRTYRPLQISRFDFLQRGIALRWAVGVHFNVFFAVSRKFSSCLCHISVGQCGVIFLAQECYRQGNAFHQTIAGISKESDVFFRVYTLSVKWRHFFGCQLLFAKRRPFELFCLTRVWHLIAPFARQAMGPNDTSCVCNKQFFFHLRYIGHRFSLDWSQLLLETFWTSVKIKGFGYSAFGMIY